MQPTYKNTDIMLVTAVLTGLRKIGPSSFRSIFSGLGFNHNNPREVHFFSEMIAKCHTCGWVTNPMKSEDGETLTLTEQGEAKADQLLDTLANHGVCMD